MEIKNKEQKLAKLKTLTDKFAAHIDDYKNPDYNEANLRLEFLNPFFELLDWDVRNEQCNHINYKDVVIEEHIEVYGSDNKKAPDYTFRIGGTKKFFVEAKKPSVDIKDSQNPAFQIKRYGYSAGLSLSILTDFEEFSVYDTRKKPDKNDKPAKNRIAYYKFTDYIEKFDEIYSLFSKTAIMQGSFEQFEKSDKTRKGYESIDEGILELVNSVREKLAKNIAKNNENTDVYTLNRTVIKIIDRLFFLRIAEDKEVEQYKNLYNISTYSDIYGHLKKFFRQADERYNSELFKYFKDIDELKIDDKVLKEIITELYPPDCVYEFSQIPVSILGSMYEQFLGKTIHITESNRVKIEEKTEVKKAGGVYYTPEYIVNYIVQNTVGEKIKDKTPKEIEKIKILDPACGSGSFLIGAYQYLLDYHLAYYIKEENIEKALKKKVIVKTAKGYILSVSEKKQILINNIFGVDIDTQAVEVAKFSLLLKLMETENKDTQQYEFFKSGQVELARLPNLNNNIKCGNSLIGTDYYQNSDMALLQNEEMQKINAFDWDKEFSEIFKQGGFDCVIGNPPWISLNGKFGNDICSKYEINYLINKYNANTYMPNMYEYFLYKGFDLLKLDGLFGFIVPDRLANNRQFINLRKKLLDNTIIKYLIFRVPFPNITTDTMIIIYQKNNKNNSNGIFMSEYNNEYIKVSQKNFLNNDNYSFDNITNSKFSDIIKKIENLNNLLNLSEIYNSTSGFGGKSTLISESKLSSQQIKIVKGSSINRYILKQFYWFDFNKKNITGRTTDKNKLGFRNKILIRKTGNRIIATCEDTGIFPEQSLYFLYAPKIKINDKFILSILNSNIVSFYFRERLITNKNSIAQIKKIDLDKLPIPKLDLTNKLQKEKHDKLVELADVMIQIQKQIAAANTETDKKLYQQKADIIDSQIDNIVYSLYGLTSEEINLIETENK